MYIGNVLTSNQKCRLRTSATVYLVADAVPKHSTAGCSSVKRFAVRHRRHISCGSPGIASQVPVDLIWKSNRYRRIEPICLLFDSGLTNQFGVIRVIKIQEVLDLLRYG